MGCFLMAYGKFRENNVDYFTLFKIFLKVSPHESIVHINVNLLPLSQQTTLQTYNFVHAVDYCNST
jgi:hypothetical protein